MSKIRDIIAALRGGMNTTQPAKAPTGGGAMPTKRISVPDDYNQLLAGIGDGMFNYVRPRKWPIEIYDIITNLTLTNADLRQAVGHIVQLGNTGHMLSVDGESEVVIEAAVARITNNADAMFPFNGGPDGLINSLFAQAARNGATSTEWVPNSKLDGVDKVFLVPVRDIRWVPMTNGMGYYPVQIPKVSQLPAWTDIGTGIVLNPLTYYYANVERLEDSPYAVPPFLAAIEPVLLQKEMIKNIHKVVKKAGIMGLMTYKVAPPQKNPGENETKYQARCLAYLQTITDQIKGNFGDGIAAGFMGAFEFDVQSITGDARGIAEIFKLNEEQLFSAIMADPSMHGRTYSTTETYASVVFSKMISQLCNYQRVIGKTLQFGWGLDLRLAGITANLGVAFNKSEALSNLQEAQSEMIEIANADALYAGGVIDQQQKANRLGYATPAETEPRPDPALAGQNPQDNNLDQRGGGAANTPNAKKKQPKVQASLTFKYNKDLKKYEFMPEIINMSPWESLLSKDDKSKKKSEDEQMAEKFARYL